VDVNKVAYKNLKHGVDSASLKAVDDPCKIPIVTIIKYILK
jgi:hypothetical protein